MANRHNPKTVHFDGNLPTTMAIYKQHVEMEMLPAHVVMLYIAMMLGGLPGLWRFAINSAWRYHTSADLHGW